MLPFFYILNNMSFTKQAFTLVELLIVIGIIGILAVTIMVSLNPREAQYKSRDAKRIKDVQTLQGIFDQAFNDGSTFCTTTCRSSGTTNTQFSCSNNWLGTDLCIYANTIPADPLNNRLSQCINNTGGPETNCRMAYYVRMDSTGYEINVRQESAVNASKIGGDGGNNSYLYEVRTATNNLIGGNKNP